MPRVKEAKRESRQEVPSIYLGICEVCWGLNALREIPVEPHMCYGAWGVDESCAMRFAQESHPRKGPVCSGTGKPPFSLLYDIESIEAYLAGKLFLPQLGQWPREILSIPEQKPASRQKRKPRIFTRVPEPKSYEVTAVEILKLAIIEGAMGALEIGPDEVFRAFSVDVLVNKNGGVLLGLSFTDESIALCFLDKSGSRIGLSLRNLVRALGRAWICKQANGDLVTTRITITVLETPDRVNGVVVDP